MPVPPVRGVAYTFYITMGSQADANVMQVNPTLAAGDIVVYTDGVATGNAVAAVTPAGSAQVEVQLSAAQMNGAFVCVLAHDALGAEWQDVYVPIPTDTQQIGDLCSDGPGATACIYILTDSAPPNDPIADADIWVTTDLAGTNVIASGHTNAAGQVTFYLDSGTTVYVWRQKSGWDFTNPDTEVVP